MEPGKIVRQGDWNEFMNYLKNQNYVIDFESNSQGKTEEQLPIELSKNPIEPV